jgi:hypothetical protein
MALEYMRNELLRNLKEYGASEAEIDSWLRRWNSAVNSAGDPLPCPKCFLKSKSVEALQSLPPEKPKQGRSKCSVCKTYFDYFDED